MTIKVTVVGGSGYLGGELLRYLLQHPEVALEKVTSQRFAGRSVGRAHPNLRGVDLTFAPRTEIGDPDVVMFSTPNGATAPQMASFVERGVRVIDLSADFRLRDATLYRKYYGEHPAADLLPRFVYGLAELHRKEIRDAPLVSGTGCIATASILGLHPLASFGLIDPDHVVIDAKVGSSAVGAEPGLGTHHPERSGVVRCYAPTGHRHEAEIRQETGIAPGLTVHAVELIRGVSATVHAYLKEPMTTKDVWGYFRKSYGNEPFVRIVREREGLYRFPEPKLVRGTNEAHVGFEVDEETRRVVVVSCVDNLGKGGAANGVQSLNLMYDLPETTGLRQFVSHP
ncbi:MAG: N-acetyl-gamma-glutamyl-phosphate reductase [Methanobacteriota archaeon]